MCVWGNLGAFRNCSSSKCNFFMSLMTLRGDAVMHICFHGLAATDTVTASTRKTVWNCYISLAQITERGTPLRRPPVSNSTEEISKICSNVISITKNGDHFKSCYIECIHICTRTWCVMKSVTDLVTLYLAYNLIAGSNS